MKLAFDTTQHIRSGGGRRDTNGIHTQKSETSKTIDDDYVTCAVILFYY